MFFVLFSQESFFLDAGHSVNSSVLVVEMNCLLQIFKEWSILDKKIATEAVVENCIQTVQVLVVATESNQFL